VVRRTKPGALSCTAAALALLVLSQGRACAYIDPGTGSYLFQLLVGSLLAAAFVIKMYWRNIVARFRGRPSEEEDEDDE